VCSSDLTLLLRAYYYRYEHYVRLTG